MLKSAGEKDPGWAPSSWTFHCGLSSCQMWSLQLLCCEAGVWVRQEEFCVSDAHWALGTAKIGGALRCSLDISWLVACPAFLSCPVFSFFLFFWNRTSPHSSLEFSFCVSRPVARAGLNSSSFCLILWDCTCEPPLPDLNLAVSGEILSTWNCDLPSPLNFKIGL